MSNARSRGAEEARAQLPSLLADAERGRTTIISRRGRPVAALVPLARAERQRSLLPLEGSGRGLWDGAQAVAAQRDEWS